MLAQEHKLSPDDLVSKYIPEVPARWGTVTIGHLLSHTSGIEDPIDSVADPVKDRTPVDMLDMITRGGTTFRPGDEWAYNNSGYYLLGVVIEKVTGQRFDAYLSDRILQPQGMKQTRGNDRTEVIRNRVSGYHWRDGRYRNVQPVSPTLIKGAGHLISTVTDLARWDAGLQNESLLQKPLRDQLWTPALLNNQEKVAFNLPVEVLKGASYGYGWITGDIRGHRYAAHGGISPSGFTTFMLRFVDDRVTVIVLTNRSDVEDPWRTGAPRPEDIAMGIASRYIKDLKDQGALPSGK
jgi:CubicO group peptidase (beta-lactamase class C family)